MNRRHIAAVGCVFVVAGCSVFPDVAPVVDETAVDAGHDTDGFNSDARDAGRDLASGDVPDDGRDAEGGTCFDRTQNGNETDVDCGGGTCPACNKHRMCKVNSDCSSRSCNSSTFKCE